MTTEFHHDCHAIGSYHVHELSTTIPYMLWGSSMRRQQLHSSLCSPLLFCSFRHGLSSAKTRLTCTVDLLLVPSLLLLLQLRYRQHPSVKQTMLKMQLMALKKMGKRRPDHEYLVFFHLLRVLLRSGCCRCYYKRRTSSSRRRRRSVRISVPVPDVVATALGHRGSLARQTKHHGGCWHCLCCSVPKVHVGTSRFHCNRLTN
mmetsp:Transcript_45084/g.109680  ORF Transcript_45084/g.109680 Transcript_45084/m.109680 type:complete len:202 (+) Transcript_45084:439-1044(+)